MFLFKIASDAHAKYLDVPVARQERSAWCWAASAQMCATEDVNGNIISQPDIVKHVKGSVVNSGAVSNIEIKKAIAFARKISDRNVTIHTEQPSYEILKSRVSLDRPTAIQIILSDEGAHIVTVTGYNDRINAIRIYDPAKANAAMYSHDRLLNGVQLGTGGFERVGEYWTF